MLELELHRWLAQKQEQQTLTAIFQDCWYVCYGCCCQSNKTEMDARNYERRYSVPDYVLSVFRRERRCTTH